MHITKEYCGSVGKGVIRSNTYAHNIKYINNMVKEAKKDVPELKDEDIEVVQFAGERYSKTYGIEFPVKKKPAGYDEIGRLEKTF